MADTNTAMTVIQFTGNRAKETLVRSASNFDAVQTAVVDAFKELYEIVWAYPDKEEYPEEWNIDLRRGRNPSKANIEIEGHPEHEDRLKKVARGLKDLPEEGPWPEIKIERSENWSGNIRANQDRNKGYWLTVRCYLRLVVDVEKNKITDAYMYPMFVGSDFRARRGDKVKLNVAAAEGIEGAIPDGIPPGAKIVDFVVEAERDHEKFRFPRTEKGNDPRSRSRNGYKKNDFYAGYKSSVLKDLKEAIVKWCGDEYNSRFARKLDLTNPPRPPAGRTAPAQAGRSAGGGARPGAAEDPVDFDAPGPAQPDAAPAGGAAQPADKGGEAAGDNMETDVPEPAQPDSVVPDPQQGGGFSPTGGTGGIGYDNWQVDDPRQQGGPVQNVGGTLAEGVPMDFDGAVPAQPDAPLAQAGRAAQPADKVGEAADSMDTEEPEPVLPVIAEYPQTDREATSPGNIFGWLPDIRKNAMGREVLDLPPQATRGSGFAGGGRAPPNQAPAALPRPRPAASKRQTREEGDGRQEAKKQAGGGTKEAPTLNGRGTIERFSPPAGGSSADAVTEVAVREVREFFEQVAHDIPKTLQFGGVPGGRLCYPHEVQARSVFWPEMSLDGLNRVFELGGDPLQFEAAPKRKGAEGYIAYTNDDKYAVKIQKWSQRVENAIRTAHKMYFRQRGKRKCSIVDFKAFKCTKGEGMYVATVMEKMATDAKKAFRDRKAPEEFTEQLVILQMCLAEHEASYPDMKPANIGVTANGNMRLIDIDGLNGNVASFPAIARWYNRYDDDAGDRAGKIVTKTQKFEQTRYAFRLTLEWLQLPTRADKEKLEAMFGWKSFVRGDGYRTYGQRLAYLDELKLGLGIQQILKNAEKLRERNGWPEFIAVDSAR